MRVNAKGFICIFIPQHLECFSSAHKTHQDHKTYTLTLIDSTILKSQLDLHKTKRTYLAFFTDKPVKP